MVKHGKWFRISALYDSRRRSPGEGRPPKGGVGNAPDHSSPLVGGSAREVSDLTVSLSVTGVEVGAQW